MRDSHKRSHRLFLGIGLAIGLTLSASPALPQTPTPDDQPSPGIISGSIVDDTGTGIAAARVVLSHDDASPRAEMLAREDGQFSFTNVAPGPFHLAASAPGFADQTLSGVLTSGDALSLPPIRLTLAVGATVVDVTPTRVELAEAQLKEQEQQHLFGFVTNFFVAYNPDAVPLNAKQKFELSWKSHLDPSEPGIVALVAGVQQARNDFSGFGGGTKGYAKRFGAAYATFLTGSLITQSLLPSLFRQDPRYFYKGTGSVKARTAYAISTAVIRKGDNGRWQPNYSGILGSLSAGALSNFYYPAEDRKGVRLTFENAGIGIGGAALSHLAQEFVLERLTSHSR